MNKINQEYVNEVQGQEIFFRDIGCVMIDGNTLTRGKEVVLKINDKTFKEFQSAYNMSEYGTDDFETIMKMEGF